MNELQQQILELLQKPAPLSLATVTKDGKPRVRYVMCRTDENLTLRTATFAGSRKVEQIKNCAEVHLVAGFTNLQEMESYLQIEAIAEVSESPEDKTSIWNEGLSHYFSGPGDPNLVVLVMKPKRIELMGMGSMEPKVWEK